VLADGLPLTMRQRIIAETRGPTPLSAISVMEQRPFLGERLLRWPPRWSSDYCWWTKSSSRVRTGYGIRRATVRWPEGGPGLRGLDPTLFERPKS
jgi:asparagine synthase (glutamine-hydrolysing)